MVTIKELADKCGVHYNTMRKWLIDNKIPKANESRNAPFLMTDRVIEKAELYFLGEGTEKVSNEKKTDETESDLVSHLVSQIRVKDTQIYKQQEQIEHLQKLLENQQVLTLKAQERVSLLENNKDEYQKEHKFNFFKKLNKKGK